MEQRTSLEDTTKYFQCPTCGTILYLGETKTMDNRFLCPYCRGWYDFRDCHFLTYNQLKVLSKSQLNMSRIPKVIRPYK